MSTAHNTDSSVSSGRFAQSERNAHSTCNARSDRNAHNTRNAQSTHNAHNTQSARSTPSTRSTQSARSAHDKPVQGSSSIGDRTAVNLVLDDSVSRVKLVSPARARALAGLGIHTVRQLLTHFPRRYIDLSSKESVASARIGQQCTIEGKVHAVVLKRPRPRLPLVEITLVDATGTLIVTCFRQPWLADQLHAGDRVAVAGELEFSYGFKRMTNPYIEHLSDDFDAGGMIIPVHPACEKISPAWMRRLIKNALALAQGVLDPLPLDLRLRYRLYSRQSAWNAIHFPASNEERIQARRRLAYEELFFLELILMAQTKEREQGRRATAHVVDGVHVHSFLEALPFVLTEEQEQAKSDILARMAAPCTANHLLLGDVGTGKTVLAGIALAACVDTNTQALMMAPTEVLAQQHAKTLGSLFDKAQVKWGLLTGSTSQEERTSLLANLSSGKLDVLIGTHALLEDTVRPARLSLVVIDEQQRFGVAQRTQLLAKGEAPDALYLTATPIPRSLALALYGDLTLSYLRHRPLQAAPRKTVVHTRSDQGFAFDAAREALGRGEQVFVVCPLIGQNKAASGGKGSKSASSGTASRDTRASDDEAYEYAAISIEDEADFASDNLAAATKEAARLQASVFADWRVGLLHGRLSAAEKQSVMQDFARGAIDVLVATTVIEVGIDVVRATVMIVEDADRFGLAQLHQLRGRVGRGTLPSEVHLISSAKNEAARARLAAMEKTDDGFKLAEYDLSLRREGDILGNRQHGASILKLVNVVRDAAIIEAAHADAEALVKADPHFETPEHRLLLCEARRAFDEDDPVRGG